VGKLCENCGKAIYRPDVEQESKALKAVADRTGDVLRVTCPHCQFRNEFPELDMVHIFLCHECGEPVSVEEPVQ
jgi:DNA-directed RNA polymerase subunit RPC12/RpoP